MLTLDDCVAFCGLTEDQLEAVAEHEHMALVVAAEWAECILEKPNGCEILTAILADKAKMACLRKPDCAEKYRACLEEFIKDHPADRDSVAA